MRGRIWGGGYEREDLRRDEWQGATVLMMVLVCTGHRFRSTHSAAQWHSDPVTTISTMRECGGRGRAECGSMEDAQ